jgi:hypothetical protein
MWSVVEAGPMIDEAASRRSNLALRKDGIGQTIGVDEFTHVHRIRPFSHSE